MTKNLALGAVQHSDEHPFVIAHHVLSRFFPLVCIWLRLYFKASVPDASYCSCPTSVIQRAPYPFPHHPSPFRHITPRKHQGHVGCSRNPSPTPNSLPPTHPGYRGQDSYSERARHGGKRASVGCADEVGAEEGEEGAERLRGDRFKAGSRFLTVHGPLGEYLDHSPQPFVAHSRPQFFCFSLYIIFTTNYPHIPYMFTLVQ